MKKIGYNDLDTLIETGRKIIILWTISWLKELGDCFEKMIEKKYPEKEMYIIKIDKDFQNFIELLTRFDIRIFPTITIILGEYYENLSLNEEYLKEEKFVSAFENKLKFKNISKYKCSQTKKSNCRSTKNIISKDDFKREKTLNFWRCSNEDCGYKFVSPDATVCPSCDTPRDM